MRTLKALNSRLQSPWCDNLSKSLIESNELNDLIDKGIMGVTSNPTIFDQAISKTDHYVEDLKKCKEKGLSAEESYWELVCADIQRAADILKDVYEKTNKRDGYVSVEVSPLLARNTSETIAQANELFSRISRDNVMIKIPATVEGIEAIEAVVSNSIPVNVTLIFSQERYARVIEAYKKGIASITSDLGIAVPQSVASFFVSRLDSKIDAVLPDSSELRGKGAIANAALAYSIFMDSFDENEYANAQRPLWASTGTKNPSYSPVLYVDNLIAKHSVNTLPQATINAIFDTPGDFPGTDLDSTIEDNRKVWAEISDQVDVETIMVELENEGLQSFEKSYESCLESIQSRLDSF